MAKRVFRMNVFEIGGGSLGMQYIFYFKSRCLVIAFEQLSFLVGIFNAHPVFYCNNTCRKLPLCESRLLNCLLLSDCLLYMP